MMLCAMAFPLVFVSCGKDNTGNGDSNKKENTGGSGGNGGNQGGDVVTVNVKAGEDLIFEDVQESWSPEEKE